MPEIASRRFVVVVVVVAVEHPPPISLATVSGATASTITPTIAILYWDKSFVCPTSRLSVVKRARPTQDKSGCTNSNFLAMVIESFAGEITLIDANGLLRASLLEAVFTNLINIVLILCAVDVLV